MKVDGAAPRGLWPPAGGGLCIASLRGQGERFLGLTGLMAGGFVSLTAFQAEGCGGGFAADLKKRARLRRRLCRRVASLRSGGDSPKGLRVVDCHGATLWPGFKALW